MRHADPLLAASEALDELPAGWTGSDPLPDDVPALHALLLAHERAARGGCSAARAVVDGDVAGPGALSRRHLLLRDASGSVRAWGTVHDRAAGRSLVSVVVDPGLDDGVADAAAGALLRWSRSDVADLTVRRGLPSSQADSGAFADDARQQRWLADAGLERTRSWWQMSRPVDPTESFPAPGPGVRVRRVERDSRTGLPMVADLTAVHDVLEASFQDHVNYREETFEELVSRLREDPGHRWDHWWLAELPPADGGPAEPAGALVGAVSPGAEGEPDGSYVEYLGVLRTARGRGVASSLLHAVFADAALRGRASVGIEVDQDSSTGAAGLYLGLGFVTGYVTQSWHLEVPAA